MRPQLGWKLAGQRVAERADNQLLDTYAPERIGFARHFTPQIAPLRA